MVACRGFRCSRVWVGFADIEVAVIQRSGIEERFLGGGKGRSSVQAIDVDALAAHRLPPSRL